MKPSSTLRLVPAALIGLWAGTAGASGFQLLEQNASGIGNAFAGSAAVAENASTVFFNPAGMTQLEGRNVSFGAAAINTSYKFSNRSSNVATGLTTAGDGGDGGGLGVVPNGYFSMAVTKDLYFGLGIGAPFGLKTEYDNPWMGAAQSLKFDVQTLNVNPSVAYRVNDTVSLGFGLDWQKLDATYKRLATTGLMPTGLPAPYPAYIDGSTVISRLKINDDAWGWNIGALFNVSPTTKVGVSYRSRVKYNATGDVTLSSNGSAAGATALAILNGGGYASNVKADIELPDTFIASATQKLDDKWEMLGDISWTGWSSIPKIDVIRTSGLQNTRTAQTLNTDFRDTWRFALGANYSLREDVKLKFGIAYDQTPVKGADTRLVSLPDNNRTWFSFGAQWLPTKGSVVDVGAAYLYIKDPSIHNDQTTSGRGLIDGTYKDSCWILGAQYSMQF
ncbi:MAG TPA: outer membrane protein transport protein [Rhodocyclaceae bacterium]|nr:outer membrane protein transport protein [Rhodocyclaceae bacterium]